MKFLINELVGGFMRDFACSIKKLTSVLIRPGSVVRVHNGPLVLGSNSCVQKASVYWHVCLLICTRQARTFQTH